MCVPFDPFISIVFILITTWQTESKHVGLPYVNADDRDVANSKNTKIYWISSANELMKHFFLRRIIKHIFYHFINDPRFLEIVETKMGRRIFWLFLMLLGHQKIAGEASQNPEAAKTGGECCSLNLNSRVSNLEVQNSL